MTINNDEKDKARWKKNERRLRLLIIGIVLFTVLLIVIIIFFRSKIWAIVANMAVIVGLIVDLISLVSFTKGDK